jgi:hypothetical protein
MFFGSGKVLPIRRGGSIDQPLLLNFSRRLAAGNLPLPIHYRLMGSNMCICVSECMHRCTSIQLASSTPRAAINQGVQNASAQVHYVTTHGNTFLVKRLADDATGRTYLSHLLIDLLVFMYLLSNL